MNILLFFSLTEKIEYNNSFHCFEIITLLIIVLPFLAFLVNITEFLNNRFCIFLTICFIFISFILSAIMFVKSIENTNMFYIKQSPWINFGFLNISYSFLFDPLAIVMITIVTFISFLVNLYSLVYIPNDKNISRFFAFISIFTFFMIILITASNFFIMLIGWEVLVLFLIY